jgi:hypothetical protein
VKYKLTPKEKTVLDLIENDKLVANYFFTKVTDPKWLPYLKAKGFFSPEKAPGPEPDDKEGFYKIPYWNVLDYLERVSQKVNEPGNELYIDKLLEIIKEVAEYHKKTKKLDNYHIWSSFIRILSNLPNNKISMDIIDLISIWLDSNFHITLQTIEIIEKLFPKFLTDNPDDIQKAEQIIYHLTKIKKEDKNKLFKVDIYLLKEFFEKYLITIAENCTIKIVDICAKIIKALLSTEYEGTLHSLYDYEKKNYLLDRPIDLLTYTLSKILLIKTQKNTQSVKQILESFFKKSHPIFTKIALFVIGQNINTLNDIFWKILKEKGEDIFEGAILYWGDELKKVLENLGQLDDNQRQLLQEKIEIATNNYAETLDDNDEKEKWKLILQQKLYKALFYDEKFKALHDEIKKYTKIDTELQPAIGAVEISWEQPESFKSPLSIEEILEMDNENLAEFFLNFQTVNSWEGPTVEDLAKTLKIAAKTAPQKFTKNLHPFLNVGYLYISRLLQGLTDALKENNSIDYEKILDFIKKYINRDEFWQEKFILQSSHSAKHTWVIRDFCSFIKEGIQNKNYPLPEELFENVEQLIHLILKKLEVEKKENEISDYIFYSLNTPLGQIIEAYIKFILKVLQSTSDKKKDIIKNFLEKYNEFMKNSLIEAYTFFGMYFSNFYFHIDKNFTIETARSLKKRVQTWEAFMEGYFLIGRIYKEIFELMKEHYEASLGFRFKSDSSNENLITHLSLAYLVGLENLEPPNLFYQLIENFDPDNINKIISFFWRQKEYLKEDNEKNMQIKNRILDFWQFVYNQLMDKEENLSEKQEILSNIVKLTEFLPELTEPYINWLKLSAKFIKDTVTFRLFLNDLEKFMKNDSVKTAKIIGEILLNAPVFTYPKDKLETFIKYLCETEDNEVKRIGKDICEKYIKSEVFFLKEICEKCH